MIAETPEMMAVMNELGLPAPHVERARLSEYRPLERLVYAIMMDFLPRVEPYESTLTVDFFPSGEWVHMVVTLSPTHDVEFTRMASEVLARQSRNLDIPELNPVGQEVQATAYQGMRANKGVGRQCSRGNRWN